MREIKFRGKDIKTKQFVYGYYSCGYREYSYQETEEYKHWIEWWNGRSYFISEVDPNTVGQFTGLKDKNGKEIYEGDILLETRENRSVKTLNKAVVKFMSNGWEAKYIEITTPKMNRNIVEFFGYFMDKYEVVGSIHD